SGSEGFEKALGWIVALCLYKPIAAAIYVLGTLMVKNVAGDQIDPGQEWMALILGTMTLLLAVFAMPALVKFVAPAAGRGASSAFSGGAAVGAVGVSWRPARRWRRSLAPAARPREPVRVRGAAQLVLRRLSPSQQGRVLVQLLRQVLLRHRRTVHRRARRKAEA